MDVRSRPALQFDSLEERVYLSAAHRAAGALALRGTIVFPIPSQQGSPTTLSVQGNGNVSPLGPVSALGTLTSSPGGNGSGIVTIAGGQGGIVLDFTVKGVHGGRSAPQIRFTIENGTGNFTNASGQGTASERPGGPNSLTLKLSGTLRQGS